jgi:hypothetical protein
MTLEALEVGLIRWQAAASRDHRFFAMDQFLHHHTLPFAKGRFAILLKDLTNCFMRAGCDDLVGIEVSEVEGIGRQPSDRGLAGTHKPDQRQIMNGTRDDHKSVIRIS